MSWLVCPRTRATARRRELVEMYLDLGLGHVWLRDSRVAELVENALLYFDGKRYLLHAWVVMPNHVHALFTPVRLCAYRHSALLEVLYRQGGQSNRWAKR